MNLFTINTDKDVKLPDLIETDVPYELPSDIKSLYKDVEDGLFEEMADADEKELNLLVSSMFSTLQRVVLVPRAYGLDVKSPVLDFILGYINQMAPEDGLLIYSRHVAISQMLAEEIPDCVAIYGKIPKPERVSAFQDLKSGKVKILVGNLDSLGVGLNLQMLNHVIFAELPFRHDKMIQSIGRVHRQGQGKTCFANYPLAKDTIQYSIFHKLLMNKADLSKVINSKTDVERFLA
jgi:SNF2 family DNA or RNA helicase